MSSIRVEVVAAFPDHADSVRVELPGGATVRDALAAAGMKGSAFGVFGKVVDADTRLKDGDRVEIYRPLGSDPKEQRRQRAARKRR